jgi:hypothetical protein
MGFRGEFGFRVSAISDWFVREVYATVSALRG